MISDINMFSLQFHSNYHYKCVFLGRLSNNSTRASRAGSQMSSQTPSSMSGAVRDRKPFKP